MLAAERRGDEKKMRREEGRKGGRMENMRIGRENCRFWLRGRDLHPAFLSIRQESEVVYS